MPVTRLDIGTEFGYLAWTYVEGAIQDVDFRDFAEVSFITNPALATDEVSKVQGPIKWYYGDLVTPLTSPTGQQYTQGAVFAKYARLGRKDGLHGIVMLLMDPAKQRTIVDYAAGVRGTDQVDGVDNVPDWKGTVLVRHNLQIGVVESLRGFRCNGEQLYGLLRSTGIPADVKAASVLITLYEYCTRVPTYGLAISNGDMVREVYPNSDFRPSSLESDEDKRAFLCQCAVFALAPAYSDRDRAPKQLLARIKAACATNRMAPPTSVADLPPSEMYSSLLGNAQGSLLCLIGRVVAVNKQGHYDNAIATAALGDPADLATEFVLEPASVSLLHQMRMVYSMEHTKSMRFAVGVIDMVTDYLGEGDDDLHRELQNAKKWRDLLKDSPYLGLRYETPKAQQVGEAPAIVLIGLRHHENCMSDPAAKAAFRNYSIDKIREKITDETSINMVDEIVGFLPSKRLMAVARYLRIRTAEECNQIVKGKTEEDVQTLLGLVQRADPKHPWVVEQRQLEQNKRLAKFMEEITPKLRGMAERKVNMTNKRIMHLNDPAAKDHALRQVDEFEQELNARLNTLYNPILSAIELEGGVIDRSHTEGIETLGRYINQWRLTDFVPPRADGADPPPM